MKASGRANSASSEWQLSPYEQQRTAEKVITDSTEVAVHSDSVRREFTCTVCLDLLKDTVATRECGHRFCEKCITTALARCNNTCPECRTKIASKRSLHRDLRMDTLIAALFLNKDEGNAACPTGHQDARIAQDKRTEGQNVQQ
ncbi:E3 ubiquitin-protein ligase RING2-A-like [Rhipicephalus sanguineus]|uniref:E3 ubiquitin-protein ligase RING2-A-like n=1 Tax=Rhipicephalus sanguineus TaxID=34632 RepID=UPI001894C80E|nr:E3 ubiquitin-protein ligase RING2-A-like [Rhipicephalus sanguineus]